MKLSLSWTSTSCPVAVLLALLCLAPGIRALTFVDIPSPAIDISQLGRVALAGNFDSIAIYNWVEMSENAFTTNGSQSLLGRFPTGAFANLKAADAYIQTMCSFTMTNGSLIGVVVGGNFTDLGNQQVQAIALFNPDTRAVTPLPGLTGQVSSVYCDNITETVYVGGSFMGANSTNAIAWTTGWTNLPFGGFNGPVSAIAKLPNGNIVFGGSFTGIGNMPPPKTPNAQAVNFGSANVTAGPRTATNGYTDPKNIICKTGQQTGAGNEWLLQDNTPGYWQANFGFGFEPSMLRLYNAQVAGYGTKTWRYTALPLNGIMNFTYYDTTGQLQSCTSQCPLPQNNATYQDFFFVNVIGMNSFRIDISAWYGQGGGLGGIELFQNDIFSFAINNFNEPICDHVSTGSSTTNNGPWTVTPSNQSTSQYLTAFLPNGTGPSTDVQVVFEPDIKQSGNYSITVYTPGCIPDGTCTTRGLANITGQMGTISGTREVPSKPISVQLYQTNNYDKYDQVYYGYVDANSDTFRPTVTLTPSLDQSGPITLVAQRVRFELVASSGGLNGLFEFNPNQATVSTDFSGSPIDYAGTQLNVGATISSLAVADGITYAGGAFTTSSFSNIMSIVNGNVTSLPSGGLNQVVQTMYQTGSYIYIGGNFTNTKNNDTAGLSNVAAYSISDRSWQPLGAGVDGMVWNIVPLSMNITANQPEEVIAVSGWFNQVLAFGHNVSFSAGNIALWVPSRQNWLHNLGTASMSLIGRLDAQTSVPGQAPLFAGSVNSLALGASGLAALSTVPGNLALQHLPINIHPFQSTTLSPTRKRSTSRSQIYGVATGLFYESNGLNLTILGGRFSAQATNGSTVENLAMIDGSNSNIVTGLVSGNSSSGGAILAMDVQGTVLFAGGSIPGGILMYDLQLAGLSSVQPPAVSGGDAVVNDIATQPSSSQVYVGGSFTSAGSLPCLALCVYDTSRQKWTAPNLGLSGPSTISQLTWASATQLIIAGNLTINGIFTTLAKYDAKAQTTTPFTGTGSDSAIPGPITTFATSSSDYRQFFVAGTADVNGTAFISKYNGSTWALINGNLGSRTRIEGLQVLDLTKPHATNNGINANQILLVTGHLELPNSINASAAVYDGSTFAPFLLSTLNDGSPGSLRRAFVTSPGNFLTPGSLPLALGFIVLIGLAIALLLTFLLVVLGIIAERVRRKREGYVPTPTTMSEKKGGDAENVPPVTLFGSTGRRTGSLNKPGSVRSRGLL